MSPVPNERGDVSRGRSGACRYTPGAGVVKGRQDGAKQCTERQFRRVAYRGTPRVVRERGTVLSSAEDLGAPLTSPVRKPQLALCEVLATEDDWVITHSHWTGTHKGESKGVPASGAWVEVNLIDYPVTTKPGNSTVQPEEAWVVAMSRRALHGDVFGRGALIRHGVRLNVSPVSGNVSDPLV